MLKELLQYIQQTSNPETMEIGGRKYTTKSVHAVHEAEPKTLEISTLTGLVDYIKGNVDALDYGKLIVHVEDNASVCLRSALHGDFAQRDSIMRVEADLLQMKFNNWIEAEPFCIFMQACFQETEDRAAVMRCAGTIVEGAVRTTGDDGVSQEVTVRQGIQRKENQVVPNPVVLKPFRTFTEVDQPASQFVFRMKSGPECMLVEADGGAWRNVARQNIKDYLSANLPTGIAIIA